MQAATDAVLVTVAVPDREQALALAQSCLRRRLVACAQTTSPIESHYHWQGQLETASECLLFLKTRRTHLEALEALLVEKHPYDVPEILVTAIESGHAPYLDWLRQETTDTDSPS